MLYLPHMKGVASQHQRQLRRGIRRLERVKTWQLVVLLVMVGFVAATFLRLNNIGMIERRAAVEAADREGDRVNLEARLYDLQRYVSSHMNADPGRIALDQTYQRDNQRHKDDYAKRIAGRPESDVFQQAEAVCGPQARAQGWRWPDIRYAQCMDAELAKHPAGVAVSQQFRPLPPEPYYQTFSSPLWSPDFAGWSVLLTGVIAGLIVLRLATSALLRLLLYRHYRRIRA